MLVADSLPSTAPSPNTPVAMAMLPPVTATPASPLKGELREQSGGALLRRGRVEYEAYGQHIV